MSTSPQEIRIFVEDTSGERFECNVPADAPLSKLAADFFDERGWPTRDNRGRGQRAVVELVDPENPERTKRLRGDQTPEKAGLWDGAILRVFPESIAGRVDERERVTALVADYQDMVELVKWNTHIKFEANSSHAPWVYNISFDYKGFSALSQDGHRPLIATDHKVKIVLGAGYPRVAPTVNWLTPIFHPNISPYKENRGTVCLGVLMDRYLPGLGLARLVIMLTEILQYRNFDAAHPFNKEAAGWAEDPKHWQYIYEIGGSPTQGPVEELLRELEREWLGEGARPRLKFRRLNA